MSMDYEKKYRDLVEAVKELQEANPSDDGIQNWIKDNVPELKESEDERIRKAILKHIQFCTESIPDRDKFITWLEKQGEQNKWKPSKDEMDALYGLAYMTNKMDDKKDEAITKLYQDLKKEFFDGASYENMFPSSPVDYLFPELRENEDDMIRKAIIDYLIWLRDFREYGYAPSGKYDFPAMIAWLEKHKYTEDDLDKAYKCADEVQYRRGYEDAKKKRL